MAATSLASADPPKREVPDYDGRGNAGAHDEPVIVWVPRIILSPLYAVNEYLLRRPIGWVVRHAESGHWVQSVEEVFKFGPNGENIILPTFLFDFGLLPSVGLYYSGDNFLVEKNNLALHGATWGPKWINITAADRYKIDESDSVQARFEYRRSLDTLFYGIGPDVVSGEQSRYGLIRVDGNLSYRRLLANESWLDMTAGMHHFGFVSGTCCGNPSLDEQIANNVYPAPPGYREAYTTAYARLQLTLDSRAPRPKPGSGIYFYSHANASQDVHAARSWLEYGSVLGAAVDLTGHQRTIKLQVAVNMLDAIQGDVGKVPFTEYPTVTNYLMPGFVPGWLTGLSNAAAQIGYTWPVWAYLDGQVRFAVGNAFGYHLDGLAPRNFRFSGDIGFTTTTARDNGFEVLFGLGTETVDQGAGITSVRITFGSRRGF